MAKYFGYNTLIQQLNYVKNNAQVMYLANQSGLSYAALTSALGFIVSANVSTGDFTLASSSLGDAKMTVAAKNSLNVEGSGNATHLYLVATSVAVANTNILLVTSVSAQILTAGNTVNVGAWTVTALGSANNTS